jgi:hypothetical protein
MVVIPVHPFAQYARSLPSRTLRPIQPPAGRVSRDRLSERHEVEDDPAQDDFFANNAPCTD